MNQNENQNDSSQTSLSNELQTSQGLNISKLSLRSGFNHHPVLLTYGMLCVLLIALYLNWNSLVEGIVVLSGEVFEVIKNL